MLYPFARMFGSPPESELAKCREAFAQFQATLGKNPVGVAPVLWVSGTQRTWRLPVAVALADELRSLTSAPFAAEQGKPDVPPPEFRHNQLRYLWERGAQYAAWRYGAPTSGSYTLCVEVWGHDGKVGAIQVYVLNSAGQIAYRRLYNSHHFGPNLPLEIDATIRLIGRGLLEDLKKRPEQVFPPYGVG